MLSCLIIIYYCSKNTSYLTVALAKIHIIKNMSALSMNHLTNIASLPSQKWENEKEYTHWDQRIKTYFLAYVDLIGETHFGDIKNVYLGFHPELDDDKTY